MFVYGDGPAFRKGGPDVKLSLFPEVPEPMTRTNRAPRTPSPRAPVAACAAAAALVALAPLVLLFTGASAAQADTIRALEGDLDDEVASIEKGADGRLVLKTRGGRSLSCADVKEVQFPSADKPEPRTLAGARLILRGAFGDEIAGELAGGDAAAVKVQSTSLGPVEVKLDHVRAVLFTTDEGERLLFRKDVLPLAGRQDIVVLKGFGKVKGAIETIDARGVAIESSEEGLEGRLTFAPEKLVGGLLAEFAGGGGAGAAGATPADVLGRVDLGDGGFVTGPIKGYRDGLLSIGAAGGAVALRIPAGEIRTLSFTNGSFVYLSDLRPESVDERLAIDGVKLVIDFPFRTDQAVTGSPIVLDGKPYRKGVGVHAYCKLAYRLDGAYTRLRAVVGLDDEARAAASDCPGTVHFRILVDGRPAKELGEAGLPLSTLDPARPIDIDLAGAAKIELVADFGESLVTLARGVWADAYLIKRK